MDIRKDSTEINADYIAELAMECKKGCRKECNKNGIYLNIDLNNDDIVKAFRYAYTKGYLRGRHDVMVDMRKDIENLNKDKE